jgi:hypothetical protein
MINISVDQNEIIDIFLDENSVEESIQILDHLPNEAYSQSLVFWILTKMIFSKRIVLGGVILKLKRKSLKDTKWISFSPVI